MYVYVYMYVWVYVDSDCTIYLYMYMYMYMYICTGCAKKKERHFKYINKIANNYYIFLKIKLTTHNYICSQMLKYEVCILNIH